jgi:hypothetical protein
MATLATGIKGRQNFLREIQAFSSSPPHQPQSVKPSSLTSYSLSAMDTFTYINSFFTNEVEDTVEVPTSEENGGSGGGAQCTVA